MVRRGRRTSYRQQHLPEKGFIRRYGALAVPLCQAIIAGAVPHRIHPNQDYLQRGWMMWEYMQPTLPLFLYELLAVLDNETLVGSVYLLA